MPVLLDILKYIILFVSILLARSASPAFAAPVIEASYENLGIPLESRYEEGITARTAWDVEVFDSKVFVASGDYDTNKGPVDIYAYDIESGAWLNTGTLPDEQAERMYLINNSLVIPGCDPRESWEWGNIYYYQDGSWITKRNIPGGIHQFDIIEFEGKLFVGLGVEPGAFPIAVSSDGGNTYQSVSMYKNGKLLNTTAPDGNNTGAQVRVKDLFTLKGKLYAFYYQYLGGKFALEIYCYENNAFYYHSDLPQNLSYHRTTYEIFNDKAEINNRIYFTTGRFYVTDDLKTAQEIRIGNNETVTDLCIINENLYICSIQKAEDGTYRSTVWMKNPYHKDNFKKLFYFYFDCPVQSFTYHDGVFYFGTGDGVLSRQNPQNGTILSVAYDLQ